MYTNKASSLFIGLNKVLFQWNYLMLNEGECYDNE